MTSRSNEIVSDADVERCLDYLRDNAQAMGAAKAEVVRTEGMVKHIKAIEMQRHNELPVSAQEREALASKAYVEALNSHAAAASAYEIMRALSGAAEMKIEVWRSAGANYRAMKL
jgi:hypothetical protein